MDRGQLAEFLRARREALQPEDVGLPRGTRRRTRGLRREEVASLCAISTDYYSRIEQQRGPRPSNQILAAIARGLHLSAEERDHLFRLAGHPLPRRIPRGDDITPGMMRIFERLADTPAQVMTHIGETLQQTPLATTLFGDQTAHTGLARSMAYRWFTESAERAIYVEEHHPTLERLLVNGLRQAFLRDGPGSRAAEIVDDLLATSPAFETVWREHSILANTCSPKRIRHPALGVIDLECQILVDTDGSQMLLVYTAPPGSASHAKLQQLQSEWSATRRFSA